MTTSKLPEQTTVPIAVLLPADVTAPAIARHAVRDALLRYGCDGDLLDDVLLATSELVTNAVEHGDRPERLELEYRAGRLVLRVFDTGPAVPELRIPEPTRARSRGLQLVRALAEEWGFSRSDGGKYVWARFVPRS